MWKKIVKDNKLLIVTLVSLIVLAAIIFSNLISFLSIESLIVDQLKENQMIKTEHGATQIENHFQQVEAELVTMSKFPLMSSLDINKCTGDMRIIHENIKGKIDSLLRADVDGNIIESSSPQFSNYIGLNIKNKEYFITPKETDQPFIASMIRQGTSKQIIISTPLFDTKEYTPYPNYKGDFKGILLSIVEVDKLYNLYIHPIIEKDKNLFLIINVGSGETILKSDDIGDYSVIKDNLPITGNNFNTIADLEGFGNTIITSSDMIIGSERWRLIILTPIKNVDEEMNSMQQTNLFSLGFIIIVIITVFFLMISLYRSREELQSKIDKTNITLEKLGIKIDTEKDRYNQADIKLDAGKVYLVKEDEENNAHELFISALNKGFAGLGIVRDDPREIKKRYNLQKTSFIWMSSTIADDVPSETSLSNLLKLITEFVRKSRQSVVLLDRLDYILASNSFEDLLRAIYELKDLANSHECIILLSVNPELIEDKMLKSIESETIDVYGKHLKRNVVLSDMEMKILKYVNEKNIDNLLVSYKDITHILKITKPTTRAKINRLQHLGLLHVEEKGRFKSLKISSAGRRILG